MTEPEDDAVFAELLDEWRKRLGPEKDEGLGLLWKEGGIEALFELMRGESHRAYTGEDTVIVKHESSKHWVR